MPALKISGPSKFAGARLAQAENEQGPTQPCVASRQKTQNPFQSPAMLEGSLEQWKIAADLNEIADFFSCL